MQYVWAQLDSLVNNNYLWYSITRNVIHKNCFMVKWQTKKFPPFVSDVDFWIFIHVLYTLVCRDSSVGITTRYGLDGPGIELPLAAKFSAPFQTGTGAHPASYTMVTASFPGLKRRGRGVDHSPPSSAEVTERVELYIYFPFRPSWLFLGWDLLYLFTIFCGVISCSSSLIFWYMIWYICQLQLGLHPVAVVQYTQSIHRTTQIITATTQIITVATQ
jgi:hypothetical protein